MKHHWHTTPTWLLRAIFVVTCNCAFRLKHTYGSFQFDFIYNKLCSMKNTTVATRIKQENFDTDFSTNVTMSEKCISQFNSDEESWESYIERLEQYFVLHGTANDKCQLY